MTTGFSTTSSYINQCDPVSTELSKFQQFGGFQKKITTLPTFEKIFKTNNHGTPDFEEKNANFFSTFDVGVAVERRRRA